MKLTLSDLANLQNQGVAVTQINNNSTAIEDAVENTLSRDGTEPNSMNADFDMNSNDILNVSEIDANFANLSKLKVGTTTVTDLNALEKFTWQGAYDGAKPYDLNDVVSNQGASWISLAVQSAGIPPPTLPVTQNDYWSLMAAPGAGGSSDSSRISLTSDTTFYAIDYPSTGGVGGGTGTGTSLDPFVGPQYALDWIKSKLDSAGFNVTLTFTSNIACENGPDGLSALTIDTVPVFGGGRLTLDFTGGAQITCASLGVGIANYSYTSVTINNPDFYGNNPTLYDQLGSDGITFVNSPRFGDAGAGDQIYISSNAELRLSDAMAGTAAIYGSAHSHITADEGGTFVSNASYTITGTPTFSGAFCVGANSALIEFFTGTFTGSAIGTLYKGSTGTTISSANTLPGNSAGTLDDTSSYNGVFGRVKDIPAGGTINQVLSKIDGTDYHTQWSTPGSGSVTAVSVASSNGFAGSSSGGATPALTLSTTVTGILKGNGTAISAGTSGTDYSAGTSALATGILKSTTSTGALTIAVAADFPTLNQNTSGTAASFTGSLAGDVTGSQSATVVGKINGTSLAGLATGIVKNTTTTGVPSIAVAGDFPTLNQNTTGSAAKWTTARNLAGNSVDGSGNVTFANKVIVQGTTDAGLSAAQFLGSLSTGLVKNTTTTGVLSIAVSGTDYDPPTTAGTGLTRSTNTFSVNSSQSIATLSNLTTNGLVTTSAGAGTLGVTVPGTGILTALGVNVGSAGAPVINGGVLGTPSSGTATNLTGTAASLTAGNVTTNANLTGPITSSGNATSIASQTGTGTKFVVDTSPALAGTPTAPTATVGTNTTQIATTAFVLANAGGGGLTIGTDTATTSGTTVSVATSLPSTIKQLTMNWRDGSTSGINAIGVRFGDATTGGFVTTGYTGWEMDTIASTTGATTTVNSVALSDRAQFITTPVAAWSIYTTMQLTLVNSASHIYQFSIATTASASSNKVLSSISNGYVTLAGALDRIELLSSSSFDVGNVNITYQ